uniref:Uncharacterized protein n=1 Tax=Anguilla anguilla TaxID=7936 RepID=A0A0E9SC68_ANGAN
MFTLFLALLLCKTFL